MRTITVRFKPFAAAGLNVAQTLKVLGWATRQYEAVCNVKFDWYGSGNTDIVVEGLSSNEVAGRASHDHIWISTVRKMTGRDNFVLGGIMLHEIGHTRAKYGFPNFGHTAATDALRDHVMHPWGPRDDWFAPAEVLALQRRMGRPEEHFWPHEITWMGKRLQTRKKLIRELIAKRNAERHVPTRREYHQQVLDNRAALFRDVREWRHRIALWQNVPMARTPKIQVTQADLLFERPVAMRMEGIVCGCSG